MCRPVPSDHAQCTESRSALVAADRRCLTWTSLLIPVPRRHQRRPPPIPLLPCTIWPLPPCCSALHRLSLLPPSPAADEPPPSCLTGPKEAPHHHAPPAPRTCSRRWLTKPGNGSSPRVIFLHEHPTSDSLLQGVHRFKLAPLPDMSNHLFVAVSTQIT
jgi:hypothetical protein